jgi:hypothetical protein
LNFALFSFNPNYWLKRSARLSNISKEQRRKKRKNEEKQQTLISKLSKEGVGSWKFFSAAVLQ